MMRRLFVDPGDGLQLGVLHHQRLGARHEFLGIHLLVGDVARQAHELLLALQQAQAQRCWAYSRSRLRASCSRSTSSSRRYQKAATMAARNSSTAASGASMAKRSWRWGDWLRHHRCHHARGGGLREAVWRWGRMAHEPSVGEACDDER
jgi:hypothetical protein